MRYFRLNDVMITILLVFFMAGCGDGKSASSLADEETADAKNIILMIGDGMGPQHILAARWKSVGFEGKLRLETLPHYGLIATGSADSAVTDSAAASTAMATGVKTNKGVIGLDPGLKPLATVLEDAKKHGKSVGLVTTAQISHATPAAFAAHVENRSQMTTIASDLLDNGVDVLLGGGEDEFLPGSQSGCFPEPGERTDGRNLINEAVKNGYTYICSEAQLQETNTTSVVKLLGLFSDEGMSRPGSPSLKEMTRSAIAILSKNPNGFFLMVEGGQIDWASHENDALNAMNDTIDFDAAVETALTFQNLNAGTLLIVTADHETGGMRLSTVSTGSATEDGPYHTPSGEPFFVNWSTKGHTGTKVPIKAAGPNSDLFTGTHENTYIFDVMEKSYHFQ